MLNFIGLVLLHLAPLLILAIPFLLLFDITLKSKRPLPITIEETPQKPDINELEEKLKKLLETNNQTSNISTLKTELSNTPSNTISAYLKLNKKDLKGFHLFQLIFSLIKNNTEDEKLIKILRHYLPSCATTHLYAMLHSFKVFLNISQKDGTQKRLMRDLNNNHVRTTLLYLEKKLNQTLNKVPTTPPSMQQIIIDKAVTYGLVFASFSEFYDHSATEKILRLAHAISPELFKYWHQIPKAKLYEFHTKTTKSPTKNTLN